MKGSGQVFDEYNHSLVDGDDELLYNSNYLNVIPLINIRLTLKDLVLSGDISKSNYTLIINKIKSIFYKERTWYNIEKCLQEIHQISNTGKIYELIKLSYCDYQLKDLNNLLLNLSVELPAKHNLDFTGFKVNGELFANREKKVSIDNYSIAQSKIAYNFELLDNDSETEIFNAFSSLILYSYARTNNILINSDDIETEQYIFMKLRGLNSKSLEKWIMDNDLSKADFHELLSNKALAKKMQKSFLVSPRGKARLIKELLNNMKQDGKYLSWKERTVNSERILDSDTDKLKEAFKLNYVELIKHLFINNKNNKSYLYIDSVYLGTMAPTTFKLQLAINKVYNDKLKEQLQSFL